MRTPLKKPLVLAAGLGCLLQTLPAFAATSKSEIDQLKQQVQQLMQQNQQLNKRLGEMEKNIQAQPSAGQAVSAEEQTRHKSMIEEEVARQVKEKGSGPNINEFVSLSGSIEGDYKLGKDFAGDHSSEFVLDTVELIMDVKVTDWATGKIVIDYDGDDEDRFYLDEAHVTLGKTEDFPFFLTGGKVFAPFGDFSTNMIQDPLTQQLGEINPKGVIAGYEKNGLTATVFSYNSMREGGDPTIDEGNDTINGFGASLAYSYEQEDRGFKVGAAWVNNIADSSTITDYLEDNSIYSVSDQVPGLAFHLGGTYQAFSVTTEYVTALDSFAATEVAYGAPDAVGAEPSAWNSELAYTTSILDKETVFAIGYQKSWEAVALELPEHRYIASAAIVIFDGTTLAFEYYHDEDYSANDGGTDNSGHSFTTRLAYEF